ncbi:hypothetical protein COJ45_07055 [Bacillus cereus]|nr:hypothetical protein COJ45_07055 [Bacillus cereus]
MAVSIKDIAKKRNMPFLKRGMKVVVDGNKGRVTSGNRSGNINVVFEDAEKYGKHSHNCHPKWETVYFDKEGEVIADYREGTGNLYGVNDTKSLFERKVD